MPIFGSLPQARYIQDLVCIWHVSNLVTCMSRVDTMHMHTCRYIVPTCTCTCIIHEHDSASIAYMQYVPMVHVHVDVPTCTVHVQGIVEHMYKLRTCTGSKHYVHVHVVKELHVHVHGEIGAADKQQWRGTCTSMTTSRPCATTRIFLPTAALGFT